MSPDEAPQPASVRLGRFIPGMRYYPLMTVVDGAITRDYRHFIAKRFKRFVSRALNRFVKIRAVASRSSALANLRAMPLTVVGLLGLDWSAFAAPLGAWHMAVGLVVTSLSAFYLERVIADDE